MSYVIGRPIEGISLNGNEYLLDDKGEIKIFEEREDCLNFIKTHVTDENPEDFIWDYDNEGFVNL